jgi:hypothetical protein
VTTAFVLLMLAALPAAGFIGWHVRGIPARMREMELQTALAVSEDRWRRHWFVCEYLPAKPGDDMAQFMFREEPEQHPLPSGRSGLPAPNLFPDPPPAGTTPQPQDPGLTPVAETREPYGEPDLEPLPEDEGAWLVPAAGSRLPDSASMRSLRADFVALRHVAFGGAS